MFEKFYPEVLQEKQLQIILLMNKSLQSEIKNYPKK